MAITVKIQRLDRSGDLQLPVRMSEHAAGFDLTAAVETQERLNPGQIFVVPCGFAMQIPVGYEAQIRPRSGLASRGVTVVNSPGTIDCDYRGEIKVPLINHSKSVFTIERGMRVAQMIIAAVPAVELVETTTLDPTDRGSGGFGHTGN